MPDQRRFEALDAVGILDSPPEAEFDDIALLARALCDTPVALVSLVHRDRQWFKARIGFDPSETPISHSICRHAVARGELLVVPDAVTDPRTAQNPLVTGAPGIRFYAGAPLTLPDGVTVGTVCVIDTEPRPEGLTRRQRDGLLALARQTVALILARQAGHTGARLGELLDDLELARKAQDFRSRALRQGGRLGLFDLDVAARTLDVSEDFCAIFGLPETGAPLPLDTVRALVLPEDLPIFDLGHAPGDDRPVADVEYRIRRPGDGAARWILRRGDRVRDAWGREILRGAVRDVTAMRAAASRALALVELGDRLSELRDSADMITAAATILARTMDASRAGFGIVDPEAETVQMQPEWRAPGIGTLAGPHHFRTYGSFIEDLKRGQTVIVADVETDPRTAENCRALLDIGIRVLINVPIFRSGRFELVVFVHYDWPRAIPAEEEVFVRSVGDRLQAALAQRRAEEEQQLLNHELNHRMKNMMAMVRAMARQSFGKLDPGRMQVFSTRLEALARAHDLLAHDSWAAADIRQILDLSVSVAEGGVGAFRLQGPPLRLGARAALSLSMLLHEMTTNAMKYGALSVEEGGVDVEWSIDDTAGEPAFVLEWRERDGPPVVPPDGQGFGSRLIQAGLVGSEPPQVDFHPEGLRAVFRAPLSHLAP
ncbi:GAF domain-containing protein [Frigidibacter oleivorans]|uniref:GAF domain-containing protein n=1 Tax=Frigidibacter oleivorans TaxID=2487129 RepID=UPI000F8DADA2|nr:GAF domain-containing protein [Frigidibacter oleivorans]